MSDDPVMVQVRTERRMLAVVLFAAAGVIVLVQFVEIPGSLEAAIYLLFFSVLPGASVLIIAGRASLGWPVALLESVVISVAIWMTAAILMAYLEVWRPLAFVVFVAVLAAVAGVVEVRRVAR
jgi:hypothetical protein